MNRTLVQLRAVIVKEIRQTVQDKRVVFLLIVAPFLQLLVFGYAINLDVDHVGAVIVDQDGQQEGRELLSRLLADGTLVEVGRAGSAKEAEAWLDDGRAAAAVLVPEGSARAMARGESARWQVLLDGSDPTRSGVAAGAVAGERAVIEILGSVRAEGGADRRGYVG